MNFNNGRKVGPTHLAVLAGRRCSSLPVEAKLGQEDRLFITS